MVFIRQVYGNCDCILHLHHSEQCKDPAVRRQSSYQVSMHPLSKQLSLDFPHPFIHSVNQKSQTHPLNLEIVTLHSFLSWLQHGELQVGFQPTLSSLMFHFIADCLAWSLAPLSQFNLPGMQWLPKHSSRCCGCISIDAKQKQRRPTSAVISVDSEKNKLNIVQG